MAAYMITSNIWFPSVFLFFFLLSRVKCRETTQPNEDNISSDTDEDQMVIFSHLLGDLYAHETKLHRCSFRVQADGNDCVSNENTSQSHFTFPSVVRVLDQMCENKNVYDCLRTDSSGNELLLTICSDVNKTVDDVCCTLEQCRSRSVLPRPKVRDAANTHWRSNQDHDAWDEVCNNCSVVTDEKIADEKHIIRMEFLWDVTCTKESFSNLPCRELNIIALNILSHEASKKLQEEAKDIIKHCNPEFFRDPIRTFSALTQEPTDSQLSSLSGIFTEDHHAGRSFGIFILTVVVVTSLVVLAWLITTRVFQSRSVSTFSPSISYSRIEYNDDALDDYSDGGDGEISMFERA